jgi:hypothetical protein
LAADFVFAIVIEKRLDLHARERIAIVNSEGFPASPRQRVYPPNG